jgi:hypothetical protein
VRSIVAVGKSNWTPEERNRWPNEFLVSWTKILERKLTIQVPAPEGSNLAGFLGLQKALNGERNDLEHYQLVWMLIETGRVRP